MKTTRSWIAILLGCVALVGCKSEPGSPLEVVRSGMAATREAVRESVADPARAAQLLAKVDELEALLVDQSRELDESALELRRLNAEPDAERAELVAAIRQHTESRRARRARALDVHFDMIALTTEEEWGRIARREREVLGAMGRLSEVEDSK